LTPFQRLVASAISFLVMVAIVDLVRRRRLREEYSVMWLGAGLVMLLTAATGSPVAWLAKLLRIEHPAYSLFLLAMLLGLVLAVHFTVVLSKLTAQAWRLTQEIALLKSELDELRKSRETKAT